jgi:hypothetical protein
MAKKIIITLSSLVAVSFIIACAKKVRENRNIASR